MDEDNFQMSYLSQKDSSIAMRVNADIKVDLFNLFSIVYEIDLFDKWVPTCQSAKEIALINKTSKAAVVKFAVGAFFFNRILKLFGCGWNRLIHRDCVTIECYSINV